MTKAHNWLIIGFDIIPSRNYATNGGLVKMGATSWQTSLDQCPSDIWLDRSVIRGTPDKDITRGIALNGARQSITGCWIGEIHSASADSQAICGWNGPGPFRIVNNYLEASGENFMLGGADPKIAGLVPSDIEFRDNTCSKPLSWNPLDPSYAGRRWPVKNLFELKNARRLLRDDNTFENCWLDAQVGFAIQITPRNQEGRASWSTVEDVTFTNNKVRHAAGGINFLGTDDLNSSQTLSRVKVAGNLFEDIGGARWGGNGRLLQVLDGATDIDISHNTGYSAHSFLLFDGRPMVRLTFADNIVARGDAGLIGSGSSEGLPSLSVYAPGCVFERNVILNASAVESRYPSGNYFTTP